VPAIAAGNKSDPNDAPAINRAMCNLDFQIDAYEFSPKGAQ
jgi:hypothetical protein